MLNLLPSLTNHLSKNDSDSLISRTYGLFKVIQPGMEPIYLQLQKNTLDVKDGNQIITKFDLKGSRYMRKVINFSQFAANSSKGGNKDREKFIKSISHAKKDSM